MAAQLNPNVPLWTRESLKNFTVGEASPTHFHALANILTSDPLQREKFALLYAAVKLSRADLAELGTMLTNLQIGLKTPYEGYSLLLSKWKGMHGRSATFGVFIDALEGINWNDPVVEILHSNWENL